MLNKPICIHSVRMFIYRGELRSAILHLIFTWNIYVFCAKKNIVFLQCVCSLLGCCFFHFSPSFIHSQISGWLLIFPFGFFPFHFRIDCAKWFLYAVNCYSLRSVAGFSNSRIVPTSNNTNVQRAIEWERERKKTTKVQNKNTVNSIRLIKKSDWIFNRMWLKMKQKKRIVPETTALKEMNK